MTSCNAFLQRLKNRYTNEWGKFYPKKVIQIVGLKFSTEISHVKFLIQKFYPKTFLSKIYVTYSKLLYKRKAITQTSPNYTTYSTLLN